MTLAFLSPTPDREHGPAAASPLEPRLVEAGARMAERDGWNVATSFGSLTAEIEALGTTAGIADRSAIGKLELQGPPAALRSLLTRIVAGGPPDPGATARLDGATLWYSSPDRAVAICEPAEIVGLRDTLKSALETFPLCGMVELTAGLAAIEVHGPRARALLERLTAIDVRDTAMGAGAVRSGAVAGVAATLLRPTASSFLILVGAQHAPDAWEIVIDAGDPLGVSPVGSDALAAVDPRAPAAARA